MVRAEDGHVKWVDFVRTYWHRECVSALSKTRFIESYHRWCKKEGYRFTNRIAEELYTIARKGVSSLSKCTSTRMLIRQSVDALNAVYDVLFQQRSEMLRLTKLLPEFNVVMSISGAGNITGPKLMGEIGDVLRFTGKSALVAFAGVDAPPYQSGIFESKSRRVSKRGSPLLRRTLFQICSIILQRANATDPVFLFMDRKRSEGKHFYVYMVAGATKLMRIYYARVKAHLIESTSSSKAIA